MRGRLQRVTMGVARTSRPAAFGDSPDAIPVFATAAHAANLAPMPTLENNATQPWHIAQHGNVAEITRRLAVMNLALRGIEADFVDCMVALPGQIFYIRQIPVCLWFLAKNKNADAKRGFRDRRKQTLFIDARKLGTLSTNVTTHEYQHRLAA